MNEHLCLQCKTVALNELETLPDIQFFECPACRRHYALKPGRKLTFRWLHPITLPLYAVIFDADPVTRADSVAASFLKQHSSEQLRQFTEEIRLELNDPTQEVRDILDCQASEEKLREFLRLFVDNVERKLDTPDNSPGRA